MGLRDPRPYCALWLPAHGGIKNRRCVVLSLFLPERPDSPRVAAAAEPCPGRWTTHFCLTDPAELDGELWDWTALARQFRCKK